MQKQGKLELTWVGKYEEKKIEPRILVEDKSKSYGDPETENMLIHGDNLIALKALEQDFTGRVKCVYIDPPFNTGSRIQIDGTPIGYDDGLEHSIWLSMMKVRLEIIYNLLRDDGALFVHIDDNEQAYLKILLDEIFGRQNFRNMILTKRIKKNIREREKVKTVNTGHDILFIYSKSNDLFINPPTIKAPKAERWHALDANGLRNGMDYELFGHRPPVGRHWAWSYEKAMDAIKRGVLRANPNTGKPQYKIAASEEDLLDTFWTDISAYSFNWGFPTCKSEELLQRIINMCTDEKDWVLDSFLGSATTIATSHKMNRKWIGIELGEHCYTHCVPRLQKVIDGDDQSGISKTVNWNGGGGFKFYELAESLLVKNPKLPVYSINPSYTFEMMAEAICKIEGFKYKPAGNFHGVSSERRFIHITKDFVNSKYVFSLMNELEDKQSLLIYCTKRQSDIVLPENVEIKKIPKDLLEKCSFESEAR